MTHCAYGMMGLLLDQKLIFIISFMASANAPMKEKTPAKLFKEELEISQHFKHGQPASSSYQFVLLVRYIGLYGIIYTIVIVLNSGINILFSLSGISEIIELGSKAIIK